MSGERTQLEAFQDAIYDWIEAALEEKGFSCPIVWDGVGGTRPKAPFVSLQLISTSRSGFPWKSRADRATGERKTLHNMRRTVSVHGWGERCAERLDEIADSISSDKYRRMLRRNGVVVNPITGITTSAEDIANGEETHSFFDIAVTYIRVVKEQTNWIESVGIQTDMPANPGIDINAGGA